MSTDTSLITFKAISNFANDLAVVFEDKHRPLKLYAHLINKTTIAHDKPIQKHINAFNKFCIANREAILEKSVAKISKPKISYSERVFIDMKDIFLHADIETQSVIWKHLLTISALVDPTGKARQVLKEQVETNGGGEVNFLSEIISKVENSVDPNLTNPMDAVSSIMKSGVFTDLVQGMGNGLQDGSLDLSKLMGTVQDMVTKISSDAGEQEGGEQAMNMINTMMSNLNAGVNTPDNNGEKQPMPDITSMLGPMMGAMMGGNNGMPDLKGMLGGGGNTEQKYDTIEDHINAQVKAARDSGTI